MASNRHGCYKGLTSKIFSRKISIIIDSNFLFLPLNFGIDIFEEFERLFERPVVCIVPSPIVDELLLLKKNANSSFVKEIEFALSLLKRCIVTDVDLKPEETVDDLVVRMAAETGFAATNDVELKKRLRDNRINVIYLRQKVILDIDGIVP